MDFPELYSLYKAAAVNSPLVHYLGADRPPGAKQTCHSILQGNDMEAAICVSIAICPHRLYFLSPCHLYQGPLNYIDG